MAGNTNTVNTATAEAPVMVCPICSKQFFDLAEYANHLMAHSNEEKKRKAEEERKARENQRSKDIENLVQLRAEYDAAKKKLDNAVNTYKSKYGLVFSYEDREKYDLSHLFDIFRWF